MYFTLLKQSSVDRSQNLNDNLYSRLFTHAIIVGTNTTPVGDFHTKEINFRLIHCFQTANISFIFSIYGDLELPTACHDHCTSAVKILANHETTDNRMNELIEASQ